MLVDAAIDPATVDLFDPQWHADGPPNALLARLRAEGSVRWNPLADGTGCSTVLGRARPRGGRTGEPGLRHVLLARGRGLPGPDQVAPLDFARNLLLYMDPPQHTKYRLILQRAFTPHAVRRLEGAVRRRVTSTIDAFIERGSADLVPELAQRVPLGVVMSRDTTRPGTRHRAGSSRCCTIQTHSNRSSPSHHSPSAQSRRSSGTRPSCSGSTAPPCATSGSAVNRFATVTASYCGTQARRVTPSASRDAALFDRPDVFDIHRDKPDHDAFGGGGRHFCLGSGLARLVGVQRIAAEAGMARTTFYGHFRDKASLLIRLTESATLRLFTVAADWVRDPRSTHEGLERTLSELIRGVPQARAAAPCRQRARLLRAGGRGVLACGDRRLRHAGRRADRA